MPRYTVYETRSYDFIQIVDASSEEEAIQIAQDTAAWEDDPGAATVYAYSAYEEASNGDNV